MGSNRGVPATVTIPMQTQSPSGTQMLDISSSIKIEPPIPLDAAMKHCHLENWAESYQDLSAWCRGTLACSPVTCQSPVTDEFIVNDTEFHGENDFDLRKSEEIASIPLEEDNGLNLWGSGSLANASPLPAVSAETSLRKSNYALLKDCWWSEVERGKAVKELELVRPQAFPTKSHQDYSLPATVAVKEEVADSKENMNPLVTAQHFLADPVKMAELQKKCDGLANLANPGTSTRAKADDLMKILQEQIAALNTKKYQSPAAVADLHNYSKGQVELCKPSTSTAGTLPPLAGALSMSGAASNIFQFDPFEGLFSVTDCQLHTEQAGMELQMLPVQSSSDRLSHQVIVTVPTSVMDSHNLLSSSPGQISMETSSVVRGSDLFFEAHHEIFRESIKPQHVLIQPQVIHNQQQFQGWQQMLLSTNQSANVSCASPVQDAASCKSSLTIQLPPPRLPELDINFDNLLFGSPGTISGLNKVPTISTPEVLKPLVETPDAESFDLLSYLCDDKVSTPSISLDNNPFHFPQPSTSSSVTDLKPNIMIVKPQTSEQTKADISESEAEIKSVSVVVELKSQLLPGTLTDVEREECVYPIGDVVSSAQEVKILPRPSRTSRKRKYSEEEFVLSQTTSEDQARSGRRRRTTVSKYESDEEFTLPVKKSRKKSVTIIEEEEEDEEETVKKKLRGTGKRSERTVSTSSESDRYRELRDRNNEASRKSRLTRKAREQDLARQAEQMSRENRVLKVKVDEMEKLVKKLREALLQSMMHKKS